MGGEKQRSWTQLLNDEIDHLLYGDESMIRDYQAIQKTWFVKGRQKVIQTYGKHEGVKLLGILNNAKIHHAKLLTRFLQERGCLRIGPKNKRQALESARRLLYT